MFINDHDEATVKADFDAAILAAATGGASASEEPSMDEVPVEGAEAVEAAEAEAGEAVDEEAQEEALEAIAGLTGQSMREDITNDIFSRFCVGK